jgi:hypothetical protein
MAEEYGDLYRKFPLTKGEQLGIVISDEETKGLRVKGEKCLVGILIKKLSKHFLSAYSEQWEGFFFFKEIQENLWLFEFTEDSDRMRVLEGRPWSYDHTLLVLNDFNSKTPPSQ